MVLRQKAWDILPSLRKGNGPYSYLHRNACVGVPTPDNAEQSPQGVGSNQDCLSILTRRERELDLCKGRGTWTRGKGVP